MYKMFKFFLKHPVKVMLIFWVSLMGLCLILLFLPEYVTITFIILLLTFLIIMMVRRSITEKKIQYKMNNLTQEDYNEMYAEYRNLINRKIKEMGVDKNHIYEDWLYAFHEHFYLASYLCNTSKLTDFHIAACIIFSLVFYDNDIEHVDIIYRCVKDLIAEPRVYIRHIGYGDEITLEVEKTLDKVDLTLIEDTMESQNIAKIIKELYISNKSGQTLTELATFLNRLYLRCT